MPVLETLARGYENFRQLRQDHQLFRIGTNAAAIYSALSLGGNVLSTLSGGPEINNIADLAAPIVAGSYSWVGVNRAMPHSNLGDAIKVLIAAGAGFDVAGEIMSIEPHSELSFLREIYSKAYTAASNFANLQGFNFPSHKTTTALIGGIASIIGILSGYSRRIREDRAAAARHFY